MAALNFPNSPAINDTYTANEKTYLWDGTSWKNANQEGKFMLIGVTDEISALAVTTGAVTFRVPYALSLTVIPRASLSTASTSGIVTVDILKNSVTILGTNKLTIDANEKTSVTAATPTSLAISSFSADDEVRVDITGAGTNATGLKVTLFFVKV